MNIRLEKIAKELLMEEDCVIIPNFGGFVTRYRPAILEPSKNILIPPGKSISFNAKLSKNDGLLAQDIAFKTGLTYNESLKAIETKVSFWGREIAKTNFLELEGLGSFILNKEGNLVFEQFNETNFANTSFGLTNVHAYPIERVGLAQRIERGLVDKKASPKVFRIIKRSAAAVIIFGVLGFGGYQVGNTEIGLSIFNTGKNLLKSNEKKQKVEKKQEALSQNTLKAIEEVKEFGVFNIDEAKELNDFGLLKADANLDRVKEIREKNAIINAKFKAKSKVQEAIAKEVAAPIKESTSNNIRYHVIAGCFGVRSNADKMIRQLKTAGFNDARLAGLSKTGLRRVSYGSYAKKVTALKALAKAKLSHNSQAWLAED